MPAATVPPISTTRAVNCEPEWLENPPHFSTSGEENAVVVSPLYPHYFPDDTGDGIKCKPLVQVAAMLNSFPSAVSYRILELLSITKSEKSRMLG